MCKVYSETSLWQTVRGLNDELGFVLKKVQMQVVLQTHLKLNAPKQENSLYWWCLLSLCDKALQTSLVLNLLWIYFIFRFVYPIVCGQSSSVCSFWGFVFLVQCKDYGLAENCLSKSRVRWLNYLENDLSWVYTCMSQMDSYTESSGHNLGLFVPQQKYYFPSD